jgi:hypothetical protein
MAIPHAPGESRRLPAALRLGRRHWLAAAGWLGTLCFLEAAYVSALAGASFAVLLTAAVLATVATVAFGGQYGYRDDWPNLFRAASVGTVVLICAAEITWVASLFIPTPEGSGGMLEILVPFMLAAIAGVLGLAALVVLLVAGAVLGRVIGLLRHVPGR